MASLEDPAAFVTAGEFEALREELDLRGHRLELLGGVVVFKMGHSSIHSDALSLVLRYLAALPSTCSIVSQSTVRLTEADVPEPDVAIAERDPETATRPVAPGDLRLVIEIAVSSLKTDRYQKVPLYASAGIPEYWIVNPIARQVEIYTEPASGTYGRIRVAGLGETIAPGCLPDLVVVVNRLMPPLAKD